MACIGCLSSLGLTSGPMVTTYDLACLVWGLQYILVELGQPASEIYANASEVIRDSLDRRFGFGVWLIFAFGVVAVEFALNSCLQYQDNILVCIALLDGYAFIYIAGCVTAGLNVQQLRFSKIRLNMARGELDLQSYIYGCIVPDAKT